MPVVLSMGRRMGNEPTGQIALPVPDQKIPNWLIKIQFLEEVETTTKSGIKSWDFSISDAIWA